MNELVGISDRKQVLKVIGNAQVIIQWLFEQDKSKIYEIKEKKQKRTLTANAYYWSLLNQLASDRKSVV